MSVPEQAGLNYYLPTWQISPYVHEGLVNENVLRNSQESQTIVQTVLNTGTAVLSGYETAPPGGTNSPDPQTAMYATLRSLQAQEETPYWGDPITTLFVPIYEDLSTTASGAGHKVVGVLTALIHWKSYFRFVLPEHVQGIVVVMEYTCGQEYDPTHAEDTNSNNNNTTTTTDEDDDSGNATRRMKETTSTEATSTSTSASTTSTSSTAQQQQSQRKATTTITIIDVADFQTAAPSDDTETTNADAAIFHVGDFQTVSPTNNKPADADAPAATVDYWGTPANNNNNPEEEEVIPDYWQIPASNNNAAGANTTDEGEVSGYWEIAPPPGEETTDGSSGGPVLDYWGVSASAGTNPPTAPSGVGGNNEYWQVVSGQEEEEEQDNDAEEVIHYWEKPSYDPATGPEPQTQTSALLQEDAPKDPTAGVFSYILNGYDADVLGFGDLHDTRFDDDVREGAFLKDFLEDGTVTGVPIDQRCTYKIRVYPSQEFYDTFITTQPLNITLVIVCVFVLAIAMFLFYNRVVERRQQKILRKAAQSTAIVSSLFPKNVRERLLQDGGEFDADKLDFGAKSKLKGFMAGEGNANDDNAAPIADLFPHCTVFFADIAGFTAWSSTREPTQVFILLQTLYQAMDELAKRRKVFKVETIGDCYMVRICFGFQICCFITPVLLVSSCHAS